MASDWIFELDILLFGGRRSNNDLLISIKENLNPMHARPPPRKVILELLSEGLDSWNEEPLQMRINTGNPSLYDLVRDRREPSLWFPLVSVRAPKLRVRVAAEE